MFLMSEFGNYPLKAKSANASSIEFIFNCLSTCYEQVDVYADLNHERVLRVKPKLNSADIQYFKQMCADIEIGDDIPGWEPGPNNI